jgi:hypothetical protein
VRHLRAFRALLRLKSSLEVILIISHHHINLLDSNGTDERKVYVKGSRAGVAEARTQIQFLVSQVQPGGDENDCLLVPTNKIGLIVGMSLYYTYDASNF